MPREPDPSKSPSPRPLPTVNVALLPHELRAARTRQMFLAVGAGLIALGLLWWAFGEDLIALFQTAPPRSVDQDGWPVRPNAPIAAATPSSTISDAGNTNVAASDRLKDVVPHRLLRPLPASPTSGALPSGASEQALAAVGTTGDAAPETIAFGKARGFRDALLRAGVDPPDADAIVTALEDHVDFRRCRPEHKLTFARLDDGSLQRFEYRVSQTELYRATRTADGFRGERVPIEIERRRVARGGNIAGSLGQALVHSQLGRSLVGAFVEVFERTISFKKDTRTGDTFRIVVDEQYVDGNFLGYGTVHALEYTGERAGTLQGFWFEPKEGQGDFFDAQGRAANGGWLRTPLRYDHISSGFNPRRRHPILKRIVPHHGVDYAAASGTPVWAAANGVVHYAGYKGANGNLVAIRHDGGYETFYAHLSRITRGIKRGTKVRQRQLIGAVGSTGRSTGPHLHFALKRRGRFIDPMKQLNGPGKPLPSRYMARFRKHRAELQAELEAIVLAPAPADGPPEEETYSAEVFHEEGAL